jgi:hypothetical protein
MGQYFSDRLAVFHGAKAEQASWQLWVAGGAVCLGIFGDALRTAMEGQVILGAPFWAWGLILGFAFLFWWMLEYALHQQRRATPTVELNFDADRGGLSRTVDKNKDMRTGETLSETNALYVRGRVACNSLLGPERCAAFLTAIEKDKTGGPAHGEKARLFDPIQLPWSFLGYGTIPIDPGIPRHFDIMRVTEQKNLFRICGAMPLSLRGFFDDPGHYTFTVTVVADGLTLKPIRVRTHWTGKWDEVEAELAT